MQCVCSCSSPLPIVQIAFPFGPKGGGRSTHSGPFCIYAPPTRLWWVAAEMTKFEDRISAESIDRIAATMAGVQGISWEHGKEYGFPISLQTTTSTSQSRSHGVEPVKLVQNLSPTPLTGMSSAKTVSRYRRTFGSSSRDFPTTCGSLYVGICLSVHCKTFRIGKANFSTS